MKIVLPTMLATSVFLAFVGEKDDLPPIDSTPIPGPATKSVGPIPEPKTPEIIDQSHRFHFAQEQLLGTSLNVTVIADNRTQAAKVFQRILQEIKKREDLISTYRKDSEISRINARPFEKGERIEVSVSLRLLLEECLYVQRRSGGAFNAFAGDSVQLWRNAAKTGMPPDNAALEASAENTRIGFRVSTRKDPGDWVQKHAAGTFDFDAIGKGYIIDKCIREAVEDFPSIRGLKLDIGGEIKLWGQADYVRNLAWRIGIADPSQPAENALPLTELELRNLAVATSGNYARALTVKGQQVNHILDPRTGQPADHVASATVVAPSAQRADALATALCVMPPAAGIEMIDAFSDAACLIVTTDGKQHRSRKFAAMEVSPTPRKTGTWPANHMVNIHFTLVRSETRAPFHRHYVGAWVENSAGRRIRILALWAKSGDISYVRDLDDFWRDAWILAGEGNDTRRLLGFSRATRAPGEYTLTWDGLDDFRRPVPPDDYTIHLDINREKGPPRQREHHTHAVLKLHCGEQPASATAKDQPELKNVRATYGPVGSN